MTGVIGVNGATESMGNFIGYDNIPLYDRGKWDNRNNFIGYDINVHVSV